MLRKEGHVCVLGFFGERFQTEECKGSELHLIAAKQLFDGRRSERE